MNNQRTPPHIIHKNRDGSSLEIPKGCVIGEGTFIDSTAIFEGTAVINANSDAKVGPTTIGPETIIGQSAHIGRGVLIAAHCNIGEGVQIEDKAQIHEHVTIERGAGIGSSAIIEQSAHIGQGAVIAPKQVIASGTTIPERTYPV